MNFENILCTIKEGLAIITINRPKKLNALNKQTIEELHEAFSNLEDDISVKVIAITGSKSTITYTSYSDAYPAGFEDIQRRVPDISKVKSVIGWEPSKDLKQIISDIAAQ